MANHSVKITNRYIINCANAASLAVVQTSLKLGPLDCLMLPNVPISVVYVYKDPVPHQTHHELIPVARLRQAMEYLLDYYPHLTGRVQVNERDGTLEITNLETGPLLLESHCDAPLDVFHSSKGRSPGRLLISELPGTGVTLLPPWDPTLEGACEAPILSIQHTRFACGGVALGVRIHHVVCDADGFFRTMRDLAELYRGIRDSRETVQLAHPPNIQPYLAELSNMSPQDRETALTFKPSWYHVDQADEPGAPTAAPDAAPPTPPIKGRVLRFSSDALGSLKAAATDPNDSGSWVSTFEALSAHIFQHVYRARLQSLLSTASSSPSEAAAAAAAGLTRGFLIPVNLRPSLAAAALPCPSRYALNALFTVYGYLPHDALATGASLRTAAKAIHATVRAAVQSASDEAAQTLRWIAAQPDKRRIRQHFPYGAGTMVASQWCKYGMYAGAEFDVDMRTGRGIVPALVAPPVAENALLDGLCLYLATEEQGKEEGLGGRPAAVDVMVFLGEGVWGVLERDEGFWRFCT